MRPRGKATKSISQNNLQAVQTNLMTNDQNLPANAHTWIVPKRPMATQEPLSRTVRVQTSTHFNLRKGINYGHNDLHSKFSVYIFDHFAMLTGPPLTGKKSSSPFGWQIKPAQHYSGHRKSRLSLLWRAIIQKLKSTHQREHMAEQIIGKKDSFHRVLLHVLILLTKADMLSGVGFEPTPTRVDCDLNAAP